MIVEKFDGGIALKSEYGEGSTFTFVVALEELSEEGKSGESRCKNPRSTKYPKLKQTYIVEIIPKERNA